LNIMQPSDVGLCSAIFEQVPDARANFYGTTLRDFAGYWEHPRTHAPEARRLVANACATPKTPGLILRWREDSSHDHEI